MRNMICTRRLNITDGTASRLITSGVNCMRRGNDAGASTIGGGMSRNIAGTISGTGTITIGIDTSSGGRLRAPGGRLRQHRPTLEISELSANLSAALYFGAAGQPRRLSLREF